MDSIALPAAREESARVSRLLISGEGALYFGRGRVDHCVHQSGELSHKSAQQHIGAVRTLTRAAACLSVTRRVGLANFVKKYVFPGCQFKSDTGALSTCARGQCSYPLELCLMAICNTLCCARSPFASRYSCLSVQSLWFSTTAVILGLRQMMNGFTNGRRFNVSNISLTSTFFSSVSFAGCLGATGRVVVSAFLNGCSVGESGLTKLDEVCGKFAFHGKKICSWRRKRLPFAPRGKEGN